MECLLEANPMPDITWFRKDQKITENARISYECLKAKKHRFLLTLTIKNPTLADGGMYRCNAFNPFGDSNANIDLNFECKFIIFLTLLKKSYLARIFRWNDFKWNLVLFCTLTAAIFDIWRKVMNLLQAKVCKKIWLYFS